MVQFKWLVDSYLHGTPIMVSFAIPMVENTTKHDSCRELVKKHPYIWPLNPPVITESCMAMDQYLLIPFLGGMNIHLPAILGFTRYQGFWSIPVFFGAYNPWISWRPPKWRPVSFRQRWRPGEPPDVIFMARLAIWAAKKGATKPWTMDITMIYYDYYKVVPHS